MAKKSARGRHPILQISFERTTFKDQWQSDNMLWERKTKAYMSDHHILEKLDCQFKPGPYDNGVGRKHSYGWKDVAKLKVGFDLRNLKEKAIEKGWKIEICLDNELVEMA